MISERKLAANRLNAKKSCGPRTAAGKSKVSRNALRHGLAAVKHLDMRLPRDLDLMARALCDVDTDHLLLQQALLIGENHQLLHHIRNEMVGLVERLRDPDALALAHETFRHKKARVKARLAELDAASDELEERRARFEKLSREEQHRLLDEAEEEDEKIKPQPVEERDDLAALEAALPDLARVARYERRAWSRYRRALRNFMNSRFGEPKD